MTDDTDIGRAPESIKPRIMLLGEFSAGKSTLANALMQQARSPVRVTATQVPPVWYSHGTGQPVHIAADGTETPFEGDDLGAAPLGDTRAVRVFVEAEVLEACDLIDMPGSSDPNMTAEAWDAMLPVADGVIWCTPATQAWRQSEAAIWEGVPEHLHYRSVLLVNRMDKVRSAEDRKRVIARVRRETGEMFRGVFPVSAAEALASGEDEEKWRASGMADFVELFMRILDDIERGVTDDPARAAATLRKARSEDAPDRVNPNIPPEPAPGTPRNALPPDVPELAHEPAPGDGDAADPAAASAILPRRVAPRSGGRRPSARPAGTDGSLI